MTTIAEFRKRMGFFAGEAVCDEWGVPITTRCTYHNMVEAMGYEILANATIGGHQGDYCFLLHDTDKGIYGFLSVGYDFCSGREALLSCEGDQEVVDLYDSIQKDIIWKADNAAEMWDWLKNRDWEGTVLALEYWSQEFQEFLTNCKAALGF